MASLPSKKQRKEKSSTKSPKKRGEKGNKQALTLDEVRKLGNELLSSRAHLNNLPVLLSLISPSPRSLESALEAMISLQSFFVPLLSEMKSTGDEEDPETVFKSWLKERFNEFTVSLVEVAVSSETDEALKVSYVLISSIAVEEFSKIIIIDSSFVLGSCSGRVYGFCEAGNAWMLSVRNLSQSPKECCKSLQ